MVERCAHVAPETLQGAAGRLDALGPLLLGYDGPVTGPSSVEQEATAARGNTMSEGKNEL